MSSLSKVFVSLSILLALNNAHMSMQYPLPRGLPGYAVWKHNEPMIPAHAQICHGLTQDSSVPVNNRFTAGDEVVIDVYGSASHNGGHCAFWVSTDDVTFTKIIDRIDCTTTSSAVTVRLGSNLPSECATRCTFAFTWIPASSGSCEIYMNCADIIVTGATGTSASQVSDVSINFNTAFIEKGPGDSNTQYGCERVGSNKQTSVFGTVYLDYPVVTQEPETEIIQVPETNTDTCYVNSWLAINLNNDIVNDGTCGDGPSANRCDDGQCCSQGGFCGPEFDGVGYLDYDTSNKYYESTNAAFQAYCQYAVGDWRIGTCQLSTSNANKYINNKSFCYTLFLIVLLNFIFSLF